MDSHRFGVLCVARFAISGTVMRVLILGGTTEASELARLVSRDERFSATLSLAGRTALPVLPPVPHRIGGFGGVEGLVDWLKCERTEVVVDATHPFASQISRNATIASRMLGLPHISIVRPCWEAVRGDRWVRVDSIDAAVAALDPQPCRVFLTIGRLELAAFRAAPQHAYVIRAIDPPDEAILPPQTQLLLERGPFKEEDEFRLLQDRAIDVLVTKNSGGQATYGKIAAARRLSLPVVMIDRPPEPAGERVQDALGALQWLQRYRLAHHDVPSERGV
jgi:precorrin-6A/cobalt-precorrin-6A reductase